MLLRWRIRPVHALAALTIFVVAAILASTAILALKLRDTDLAHSRGETIGVSLVLAEQTTRALQNVDLVLQNAQGRLSGLLGQSWRIPLAEYPIHVMLQGRITGIPQISSIFVVDAAGAVANSSREFPIPHIFVGDREYFLAQKNDPQRGLFIGTPLRNRLDGFWTLYLSRRINGPGGRFAGVVVVALNLGYFEGLYQSISLDLLRPISLFLADGTLIASEPHDDAAIGQRVAESRLRGASGEREVETVRETMAQGAPRIVTYRRVAEFPLMVSVAVTESDALAGWGNTLRYVLAGALLFIAVVISAAFALARKLRHEEALATALLESGERLQGTVDSAMDAIVTIDSEQRVILFNPAAEKMFGCAAQHAIGQPVDHFLPERYRAAHRGHIEGFANAATRSRMMAPHMEVVGRRSDGEEFPIEGTISRVTWNGELLFTAILRDVTERKRTESELRDSNRQLRELSGALQDVREKERTRIARELHDELGQQLTGLKMDLSWLAKRMDHEQADLAVKVDDMKRHIDVAVGSVRRIATELRPTLLDDLGLAAAIEWLAADFSRRSGIAVAVDLAAQDDAQSDPLVSSLFRIVQESLTNVARHAEATQVWIALMRAGPEIHLIIADNGKGAVAGTAQDGGGHGLIGIRERAIMLGGRASFSMSPGAGTTIVVTVPTGTPPQGPVSKNAGQSGA